MLSAPGLRAQVVDYLILRRGSFVGKDCIVEALGILVVGSDQAPVRGVALAFDDGIGNPAV